MAPFLFSCVIASSTGQVLRLVIRLYEGVEQPDWVDVCQCLMFLDDAPEVARILHSLIGGSEVRPRSRLGGGGSRSQQLMDVPAS